MTSGYGNLALSIRILDINLSKPTATFDELGMGAIRSAWEDVRDCLSKADAIAALGPQVEGDGWRSAFDTWVAAERARHEAIAVYNARLAVIQEQRAAGDWSGTVTPEGRAMHMAERAEKVALTALSRAALPDLWLAPPHQEGGG